MQQDRTAGETDDVAGCLYEPHLGSSLYLIFMGFYCQVGGSSTFFWVGFSLLDSNSMGIFIFIYHECDIIQNGYKNGFGCALYSWNLRCIDYYKSANAHIFLILPAFILSLWASFRFWADKPIRQLISNQISSFKTEEDFVI